MTSNIRTFGSNGPALFLIEHEDVCRPAAIQRELWFDHDLDGRWLICAVQQQGHDQEGEIGSMVVTDPRIADFIDMLAQLVDDPSRFVTEPHFHSPH